MQRLEIEWLEDSTDCDQAGCDGGYATGAVVRLNGNIILECIPKASCFGSENDWTAYEIYEKIINTLGYEVTYI